jgi:gentisate 1,2-dioxygenase
MPDEFRTAMDEASVSALWERPNADAAQVDEKPYLWPWAELGPLLDTAVAETDMANVEHRVLVLENPAYKESPHSDATLNMVVNLQVLMPSESARPHRHRLNALRFIIEGDGTAVTTVDGIPCPMVAKKLSNGKLISPDGFEDLRRMREHFEELERANNAIPRIAQAQKTAQEEAKKDDSSS